jgi:hypothetical protein
MCVCYWCDRRFGLLRLNITNKVADDDLIATLAELTAGLLPTQPPLQHQQQQEQEQGSEVVQVNSHPASTTALQLDVCLHYSLKYNYYKTPERSFEHLMGFCRDLHSLLQEQQQPAASEQRLQGQLQGSASPKAAAGNGSSATDEAAALDVHVLLVSGGGKKKRFDTVAALQALAQHQRTQQHAHVTGRSSGSNGSGSNGSVWLPSFAVAFNPYLPAEADAAEERRRLRKKLETGLVDRVYLQVGYGFGGFGLLVRKALLWFWIWTTSIQCKPHKQV